MKTRIRKYNDNNIKKEDKIKVDCVRTTNTYKFGFVQANGGKEIQNCTNNTPPVIFQNIAPLVFILKGGIYSEMVIIIKNKQHKTKTKNKKQQTKTSIYILFFK